MKINLLLTHMLLYSEFQIYPIDLQDCLQKKNQPKPKRHTHSKINKNPMLTLPENRV